MKLKEGLNKIITYVKFWRALIAFLLIMVILTIVSRVNDLKLMPQITADTPQSMAIDHTVLINGTISNNHKLAVFVPMNLKISSVNISEGMYVKKGDELFRIDKKDLEEKIATAASNARKQELQIEDKQNSNSIQKETNEIAVDKAKDDYEYSKNKGILTLAQLNNELNNLKNQLTTYEMKPLSMRDSTLLATLKKNYEDRKQDYNNTITSKAEAVATARRNLEDAQEPTVTDDNIDLLKEQLNDVNEEINTLKAILQDGCNVRVDREGIIKVVNLTPGNTTSSAMAFLLDDTNSQIQIAIFPEENLKVDSVFVKQDDHVMTNDILYRFNKQSMDSRIKDLQNDANQLNTKITSGTLSAANQKHLEERILKRAQEDYDRTLAEWQSKENEAARVSQSAKKEYETYRDHPMETDVMKQAYYNLKREYDTKKSAYASANLDGNNATNTAKNNLDTAQNATIMDQNAVAVMQEDLSLLEKQVDTLEEIKAEGGIIRAKSDGMILTLSVTAGSVTGESAAVLISDQLNGYQFSGLLPVDQSKYVNTGDDAKIMIYRGNINMEDLTITSVQRMSDNPDNYSVMVQIPKKDQEIEGNASLSVVKQSENYPNCLPKDAIHSEGSKIYVYLLVEKNTVLGIQSIADKMEVTIVDQNENYVAVDGEFPIDAKVIVSTNKGLKDGVRVRSIEK